MRLEDLRALGLCATAVATALLAVLITPLAANAVVRTTSGVPCTIVGTKGNDALTGTPRRDVICGRGGNDVLNGRGGNDLIDGGSGNDRITGGTGKDRITGGSGNDDLRGGTGADGLYGGNGSDRVSGEQGNDVVSGNLGDDDLSGGPGGDLVDGGGGFNVCDVPGNAADEQLRCVTDVSKPVVGDIKLSPTTVDVSSDAKIIRVEAHVTDDTGVKSVQIGSIASLVSGTLRDGVWATTIRVPRFIAPGPRDIDVFVRDRVGRDTSETRPSAYTVVNTVYDQEMPVLKSLSLSAGSVDVRTAAKPITATVQVTDDLAGPTDMYLCPAHAMPTETPSFRQSGACVSMSKASGTPTNSTWKGTLTVPEGATSGTWNVQVWISDAAGNFDNDYWLGPDEIVALGTTDEPRYKAIPGGAGAFTVRGSTPDSHAPKLTSLSLTPSTVDTSRGAVRVTADIAGTDVEGITDVGLFISGYAGYPNNTTWTDSVDIASAQHFERISGTATNGVWRATFVVPGGTPDGTYWIQASLQDSAHFTSWVSSDSGWTIDNQVLDATLAPTGTHFVVANSN